MGDASWDAYYTATLEFFPPDLPRLEVDLARRITHADIVALTEACPGPTFAVITASNPGGAQFTDEENEERALDLEERLDRERIPHIRADGCSPDRMHRERGIAARMGRFEARDLGAELGQNAIYWWDGVRFWLVAVTALDREPEALPVGEGSERDIPEDQTLKMTDFLRDSDFSAR